MAAALLLVLLAGSLVYCLLVAVAVRHYLAVEPPPLAQAPPISILKPLSGRDLGLKENLRSFFVQDYPEFEILFSVRGATDPAVPVVEALRREYPEVSARLIVTGEPPYANAKVFALEQMVAEARSDLLVMTDSDTRAGSNMLGVLAAEFQDPRLGLATCPYRGVGGPSVWSTLEAIGMNTEFWAGVLVARLIEGMKFGVGPSMAVRRPALEAVGGFRAFRDYLAEDFVLGQRIAAAGFRTILSSYAGVEHRIGSEPFFTNIAHRLRWVRSTRRSRPAGYIGQVFTYPLAAALLVVAVHPAWWLALPVTAVVRALAAWSVAGWLLHDRLTRSKWWLLPLEDLASFVLWAAGFFGNTVVWRGRRYRVFADGRLEPAVATAPPHGAATPSTSDREG